MWERTHQNEENIMYMNDVFNVHSRFVTLKKSAMSVMSQRTLHGQIVSGIEFIKINQGKHEYTMKI